MLFIYLKWGNFYRISIFLNFTYKLGYMRREIPYLPNEEQWFFMEMVEILHENSGNHNS